VAKMLEKRRQLNGLGAPGAPAGDGRAAMLERSRLQQALDLARKRHDWAEAENLEAELARMGVSASTSTPPPVQDELQERLKQVNEKNRRANAEAARRLEQERKRRKKLEAERALAPSTPDLGTRCAVYTLCQGPYMLSELLRPAKNGTADPGAEAKAEPLPVVPPSALSGNGHAADTAAKQADALEKSILEDVELDLGDF
jgi:RNA polymerase-associated protein RTF1